MKGLIKNRKGFSLVELLIVFAILAVMGVIAFNMYTGMVQNSKLRADEQVAKTIEKALNTYIVDSGDVLLEDVYNKEEPFTTDKQVHTALKTATAGDKTDALITTMQSEMWCKTNGRPYGPLLTPPAGKNADFANFKPQADGYDGYKIELDTKNKCCKVTPTKKDYYFYNITPTT